MYSIVGAIRLHGGFTQPVLVLRGAGVRCTRGRLLQLVLVQVRRVPGRDPRQGRRHQRHHPHLRAQPRRHLPRRRVLPRVSTHPELCFKNKFVKKKTAWIFFRMTSECKPNFVHPCSRLRNFLTNLTGVGTMDQLLIPTPSLQPAPSPFKVHPFCIPVDDDFFTLFNVPICRLPRTFYSLFWSMFGLISVDSVEIKYPGTRSNNRSKKCPPA